MPEHGVGMGGMGFFFWLIAAVIVIVPFWQIYSKAGFSKWLSLLMLLPLINLIVLYFVAFAEWPVHRQRPPAPQNTHLPDE
ncbi:MAG: hypothetical protein ACE5K1_08095 [Acidiferrobacterales bacterium]